MNHTNKDKDKQPLFEASDLEQPKIKRRGRKSATLLLNSAL